MKTSKGVLSGFKYPPLLSRDAGLGASRSEFSRHPEGLSFRDTLGSEFFGSGV